MSRSQRWAGAGLALSLVAAGVVLDLPEESSATILFCAFTFSSLAGMTMAVWCVRPHLPGRGRKFAHLVFAYIGWRVSYFPFMVFAGTFASLVEAAQVFVTGECLWIFPSYLLAFAGLHALVALLACLPLLRWRWWPLVIAPLLLQASMISFTATEDLRPLPDHTWTLASGLPPATLPQANPYLVALAEEDYSLWQSLLPFAAGSTYWIVPHTPWAEVVQGVLEAQFNQNRQASSSQRIEEHYVGYLVAHPRIGTLDRAR